VAAALTGLADGGATAVNLGVITTPGVAILAEQRGGVGIVVSASHNGYADNGLKVLGPGGTKLDRESEAALEAALDAHVAAEGPYESPAPDPSAAEEYLARLRSAVPGTDLSGLHLVIDCANGAASALAPGLFESLGATVEVLNAAPNGRNINERCGSTHPEALAERVHHSHADLGLAFDGDADRLIAVDGHGNVRDGDDLMILFAIDLDQRGELGGTLVVTAMSNLGLHHAMRNAQIEVVETDVGDRHVLEELERRGLPFGGEQSGHLIFRRLAPTGDGMLSGLLLCDLVRRRGRLATLADAAWLRLPQRLVNVPADLFNESELERVRVEVTARHHAHPQDYRLLVRRSGTEPVVRVMVEARDVRLVQEFCDAVVERFASHS
jgi:phosphoglucosamine mutase